jgi:hypothetical protein
MKWDQVTPNDFEQLCFKLLKHEGLVNPAVFAGPGYGGRDIVGEYLVSVLGNIEHLKYLVQCKRITSRTSLAVSDLRSVKDWMDANDDYHRALIITPSNVTPDTRDWIEGINQKSKYKMQVWDKAELEIRLSKHPELLKEYFKTAEILNSFDLTPQKIPALNEYRCEPIQFSTYGGEVIIAGEVTGSAAVSGACVNLSLMIDGKLSGQNQLLLANNPIANNFSYKFDRLPNGPHSIGFSLRNNDSGPQEVVSVKVRLIEIPPSL